MTERAHVTYTGETPIYLPGSVAPRPSDYCEQGTVVEVDAAAVDGLLARGDFEAGGTLDTEPVVPEPVPVQVAVANAREEAREALAAAGLDEDGDGVSDVDAEDLRGEALDQALRDAGLPLTGTAADKRERLADWQDDQEHDAHQTTTTTYREA